VISIIAILIALLLPALSKARSSARTIQCLANLRQNTLVVLMYSDASREYLPAEARNLPGDIRTNLRVTWVTRMVQMGLMNRAPIQNPSWPAAFRDGWTDARVCPEMKGTHHVAANEDGGVVDASDQFAHYMAANSIFGRFHANTWQTTEIPTGATNEWRRRDSILRAANVFALADAMTTGHGTTSIPVYTTHRIGAGYPGYRSRLGANLAVGIYPAPGTIASPYFFRHEGSVNFGFLDGHAETRRYVPSSAAGVGGFGRIHYVDP